MLFFRSLTGVFLAIFLIFFLFSQTIQVAALPMPGPHRRKAGYQATAEWRTVERSCRFSASACGALATNTEDNCVLKCQSPTCFKKVYGGEEGLEPGEINGKLQGRFSRCLRLLEKRLRKEGRWPPQLPDGASFFDDSPLTTNDKDSNEDNMSLDEINDNESDAEEGGGGEDVEEAGKRAK